MSGQKLGDYTTTSYRNADAVGSYRMLRVTAATVKGEFIERYYPKGLAPSKRRAEIKEMEQELQQSLEGNR